MKKKFLLLICFVTVLLFSVQAQKGTVDQLMGYTSKSDSVGWSFSGLVGLTFGQTSLTNWSAGGDNTISGDFMLNASANYLKNKWFWDNNLFGEYGMIYSSSYDWRKSTDKINFTSVAGHGISSQWSVSLLLNFRTQLAKGYDYPNTDNYISGLMVPGYSNAALGFTYKPNAKYTVFLSPVTERATFVLDKYLSGNGKFGVNPGEKVKWETGAYVRATTNQTIAPNLSLISTLDMFTSYSENFGNIDINWDILLSYKINKLLTTTLNTTLRHYDAEIQKLQFKEVFGLGFTYNFNSKK
ncbi:MAG: DUF3078 domain-containing protein [Dysgonamonadaceae bacterium]|jgi:hypothetical protein|nr:DUF3078 domain-containing protein [Dysgonamonadaceae bacterium]